MNSPQFPLARQLVIIDGTSIAIFGLFLIGALLLHLVPALFSGMVTFLLIHQIAAIVAGRTAKRGGAGMVGSSRGKVFAVSLIAITVASVIGAVVFGLDSFLKSGANVSGLLQKMATLVDSASRSLPPSVASNLPTGSDQLRTLAVNWLREHASSMQSAGQKAGISVAHILVGVIIGAMVSMHEVARTTATKPLSGALMIRVGRFAEAFRKVVFAQIKVSLINTSATAVYLLIALPLFGVHLPFIKTMLALTFVVGLLPVVGNLLSNAVLIIVSTSQSFHVAIASLIFLIVIHKVEYFLNAKIVGGEIRASAWELLFAMLVMEAMFGIAGVVAAPVFYAYMKAELSSYDLI
ncbi:hypothetical protein A9R05_43350 (plasmid) [Burkholderia sp. KK1]|nr:AI-2E family transporter [Burkholderia sp. M701]AQH05843.1 hypothetical protein A9R05_43350 [Burkholderia sp. KK1]